MDDHTDNPVWIDGVGWNIDSQMWANRDLYFPRYAARAAKQAYDMGGTKIYHTRNGSLKQSRLGSDQN